ncbi:MAG TPA: PHP domain-containing protein, partial [Myxococcota bacterium]
MIPGYAELHCLSCYSFLRGASGPEELVQRAVELGYTALALTDECSVAGIVRAHVAAKEAKLKLVVGSEFTLADGLRMVLLVQDLRGYETLCELITKARRAAPKGEYRLAREDIPKAPEGLQAIWLPGLDSRLRGNDKQAGNDGSWISSTFPGNAWIGVELHRGADDAARV